MREFLPLRDIKKSAALVCGTMGAENGFLSLYC